MLLRTYDCQEGTILFDGRNAKELNPQMVRSQIGTSLQEPFLFSTTIKSNIKIAKEDATDTEVTDAAKTASIHDTVQNFIDRYDSEIGEKGVSLSGQWQRLAMARSFVKRPQILMLDDSLSAVNTKTEREIVQALDSKHQDVTTILVTHRLSCCINTDRILVLENGELVAQGRHEQLIKQEGFYKRLWGIQKGIKNEAHLKKLMDKTEREKKREIGRYFIRRYLAPSKHLFAIVFALQMIFAVFDALFFAVNGYVIDTFIPMGTSADFVSLAMFYLQPSHFRFSWQLFSRKKYWGFPTMSWHAIPS